MNRLIFFLLLSFQINAQSPIEKNGFIEVEAENFESQTLTSIRKWEVIENNTSGLGFSAGKNKYIQCLPDTRVTHGDTLINGVNFSNESGKLAVLSYKINFSTPGRYYVWVRAFSSGSEDNGIHLGLNGDWVESGKRMQWCEGKNKWTWASKQRTEKNHCGEPFKIYLDIVKTGENLIQFSMREDGFQFDKFLLTQEKDFNPNNTLKLEQIYIRDPFFYTDFNTKTYYLFATANKFEYLPDAVNGVLVYTSKDLKNWSLPKYIFKIPEPWWASSKHRAWAPEVHYYKGKYYLFATFTHPEKSLTASDPKAKAIVRGTAIMVSDSIDGTYKPFSASQTTPPDWMALDGTLMIENNKPYMVFCHEWIQVKDGTMEVVELEKDLSGMKGKPKTMFRASDASWVKKLDMVKMYNTDGFITDGPWFYKTKNGKLLMLWSSFGNDGYGVGVAESSNGKLHGKWKQKTPLFKKDGGHSMIFKTLDGKMILTLHQPNSGDIRAKLFEIEELGDELKLISAH